METCLWSSPIGSLKQPGSWLMLRESPLVGNLNNLLWKCPLVANFVNLSLQLLWCLIPATWFGCAPLVANFGIILGESPLVAHLNNFSGKASWLPILSIAPAAPLVADFSNLVLECPLEA